MSEIFKLSGKIAGFEANPGIVVFDLANEDTKESGKLSLPYVYSDYVKLEKNVVFSLSDDSESSSSEDEGSKTIVYDKVMIIKSTLFNKSYVFEMIDASTNLKFVVNPNNILDYDNIKVGKFYKVCITLK